MKPSLQLETRPAQRGSRASGGSLVEVAAGLAISLILTAISVPSVLKVTWTYQLSGSARGIASQLALTKLLAAANFSQAQLNANIAAGSYEVDLCTTRNTATGGCTTFTQVGGTQYLPAGITFSYGSITTIPPNSGQTSIAESAPIIFNSRGVPVNTSGSLGVSNYALYLTNNNGQYYAVTVAVSGKVTLFKWQPSTSAWQEM